MIIKSIADHDWRIILSGVDGAVFRVVAVKAYTDVSTDWVRFNVLVNMLGHTRNVMFQLDSEAIATVATRSYEPMLAVTQLVIDQYREGLAHLRRELIESAAVAVDLLEENGQYVAASLLRHLGGTV